ncbi:hypothetical protein PLESTB_001859000 [Pleodorina starrii]|uniref:Uncharacterized protein n=1 Tax=Pleodorina starrii TaxID=330485 RepID=A0A9W6C0Z8_9CHLO|nr:hypothetical protein PLESTM_000594100 [Pleodorina starrii]GLC62231.1 hypothetical protein PLESTB_001859000 [Pleodorina starrii]
MNVADYLWVEDLLHEPCKIVAEMMSNEATLEGMATATDVNAVSITRDGVRGFKKLVASIPPFIKELKVLVVAVITLLFTVISLAIIVYLVYYQHPRPFFLCCSGMFGWFMEDYTAGLVHDLSRLRDARAHSVLRDYAQLVGQPRMFDKVAALQIPDSALLKPENVANVLRFWDSLADRKKLTEDGMVKADLMMLDEAYLNADGEPDAHKLEPLFKLREQLGRLHEVLQDAKNTLSAAEDLEGAARLGWLAGLRDADKLAFVHRVVQEGLPALAPVHGDTTGCAKQCTLEAEACLQACEAAPDNAACKEACHDAYRCCKLACFDKLLSESAARNGGRVPVCSAMMHDHAQDCRKPLDGDEMMYCNLVWSGALQVMCSRRADVLSFLSRSDGGHDVGSVAAAAVVLAAVAATAATASGRVRAASMVGPLELSQKSTGVAGQEHVVEPQQRRIVLQAGNLARYPSVIRYA